MGQKASRVIKANVPATTPRPIISPSKPVNNAVNNQLASTTRPVEDTGMSATLTENLRQLQPKFQTTRTIISPMSPQLETLRRRKQLMADGGGDSDDDMRPPAGRVNVSQLQQILGEASTGKTSTVELAKKFKIDEKLVKDLLQFTNTFTTTGSSREGLTGHWTKRPGDAGLGASDAFPTIQERMKQVLESSSMDRDKIRDPNRPLWYTGGSPGNDQKDSK